MAAAWPPWDLSFFAWVALIPWFQALSRSKTWLRAAAQGLWLSFVIGVLAAPWVANAAHEFLELSWPSSVGVLLLFAATCAHPHLIVLAPLIRWADRRLEKERGVLDSLVLCSGLALLYTGLDAAVPRLFDAGLGYALHGSNRLRQLADVGGVSLLTCLLVWVNLLAWRAGLAIRVHARQLVWVSHLALISVLVGSALVYGSRRIRTTERAIADAQTVLQVGVVQGNVANEARLAWARGDERAAERQLSSYMLLTEELVGQRPSPDLVVWPEATFPGIFLQPRSTLQRGRANKFDRQVLRLRRPLVFGAYDLDDTGPTPILYNAIFAVTPRYDEPGSQGTVQRYHKRELLAFAEHIPGISQNDWFRRNLPSVGFFGAGKGPGLFDVETPDGTRVTLGPFICSESLSTDHVIETARRGAAVLLNVGSDGWFGRVGEPQFHLAAVRLRSVETRRPQIRAANTGISALILPGGDITARTELGAESVLNASLPLPSLSESLMMRWGDWFPRAASAAGLLLFVAVLVRGRRNQMLQP